MSFKGSFPVLLPNTSKSRKYIISDLTAPSGSQSDLVAILCLISINIFVTAHFADVLASFLNFSNMFWKLVVLGERGRNPNFINCLLIGTSSTSFSFSFSFSCFLGTFLVRGMLSCSVFDLLIMFVIKTTKHHMHQLASWSSSLLSFVAMKDVLQ